MDTQVTPVLETLFLSPVLTAENYFKSAPESYKSGGKSFILHQAVRKNLRRVISNVASNYCRLLTNYSVYRQSRK